MDLKWEEYWIKDDSIMTIAARIKKFLNAHKIGYHVYSYPRTTGLAHAIELLKIPINQCAKSIGLMDKKGMILAVIPYDYQLNLKAVNTLLHRQLKVVTSLTLDRMFYDCEPGAHPVLAEPYGINMVVDEAFYSSEAIYFAPGTHSSLLRLHRDDFCYLTANQKWRKISFPLYLEQES